MVVALLLLLVAVGTVVFHFWSPWWWTPIASNWGNIDTTIIITFWVTGVVFVLVLGFTAYCVYRYRNTTAEYEPENKKLEIWLSALTTLGVIAMLAPGLWVWNDYITVPKDALRVEALGKQWSWSYRLPGKDGVLGRTNPRIISDRNPFGIDPKDPKGQDDLLIDGDDLHLLKGKSVKMELRSIDVLHNFYVPQFRGKMDMVPGMITYFWFQPTRNGTFDVLCFELCGVGHHAMRSKVVVEDQKAYDAWLKKLPTFAQSQRAAEREGKSSVKVGMKKEAVAAVKTAARAANQ